MSSLSPHVRTRLERLAADWREAAGFGRAVELSPPEARELADALTTTITELDLLRAEVTALKQFGIVVTQTETVIV